MTVSRVVLLYGDDIHADELFTVQMPYFGAEPYGNWIRFPNAFTDSPLCGTSRGQIITGQRMWETGILEHPTMPHTMEPFYGETMFDSLSAAGVFCGMVGKWINNWNLGDIYPSGVAHGCVKDSSEIAGIADKYTGVSSRHYKNGAFSTNVGTAADYWTDHLAVEATEFIDKAETLADPWFLMVPFGASHGPSQPATRHVATPMPLAVSGAFNQVPSQGRPSTWAATPMNVTQAATSFTSLTNKGRCLLAVDELAQTVLEDLNGRGVLDETLIIFANDQSVLLGHYGDRYSTKRMPHRQVSDSSLRIRWPAVTSRVERRFVGHLDLTATIMAVLGATPLTVPHGRDLTALITTGTDAGWRKSAAMSICNFQNEPLDPTPTWFAVRYNRWMYAEFYGKAWTLADCIDANITERFLYDLNADPYELNNVVTVETTVAAQMKQLLAAHKADPTFGGGPEDL